jgi:oligogalacturonide lyase
MGAGRTWLNETELFTDPISGRKVTRLTNYLGHSFHLYFTDPCFFNGDKSFVFISERENKPNVYRHDLDTGIITQLTDMDHVTGGFFSVKNNAYYFWRKQELLELNVDSYAWRVVYEAPAEFVPRKLSVTVDGKYVCSLLQFRKDVEFPAEVKTIPYAFSGFDKMFEARPLSRIVRIDIATGKSDIMHEDRRHMGHVNTSPTRPELLTFCHEGPWYRVDQRIWGMNLNTGEVWKLRPQSRDTAIGHEYWFADGETVGYHGRMLNESKEHFFGIVRWDGSEGKEFAFPFKSGHFSSSDADLMVGDGTPPTAPNAIPYIMLFRREDETYAGPRILCQHRSTFNNQHAHPHPRFTPDGKHIMFTSDLTNYSNIYLVEVGNFDDLPEVKYTPTRN